MLSGERQGTVLCLAVGAGKIWGTHSFGISRSKSYYWLISDVGNIMKNVTKIMKKQAKT